MSGLYDDLGEVSRVKKEPVNPSSLYAHLAVDLEKTNGNNAPRQEIRISKNPIQSNAPVTNQPTALQKSLSTALQTNALFVGNLKWWTRDQDLLNIFSQFGTVTALKIHADKVNGKSKGYAYIEYSTDNTKAAAQAKDKLHGFTLHGGKLTITFASPDKIKLPEFSNTPFVPSNPNTIPQANVVSRRQTSYGTTTSFDTIPQPLIPGLPALSGDFNPFPNNPLQYGMTNTALLKQLNGVISSLRGKDRRDSSGSQSRSSSYTQSRSRTYSRSHTRSRSRGKNKLTKRRRITKTENRKERPNINREKEQRYRDRSRDRSRDRPRGRRRN